MAMDQAGHPDGSCQVATRVQESRPDEPSGVWAGGELTCEHERVTVERVTGNVRR